MPSTLTHKPLVVGIDETGRADEAVRAAVDLAQRLHSSIYFIHALPNQAADVVVESISRRATFAEQAAPVREHLRARLRQTLTDLGVEQPALLENLRVLPGPPARALLEAAREHGAGTIFIGPHQSRGLFDFGSTARAVLSKAPAYVWMQPSRYEPIRSILVPVDLSADSLHALRVAIAFARTVGATLTVLHCFVTPEIGYAPGVSYPLPGPTYVLEELRTHSREEFERAMANEDWQGVVHHLRFLEGRPAMLTLELALDHDLTVMGSHGRTGLSAALLGNVAYAVLKDSQKPVLAVRHPDREFLL